MKPVLLLSVLLLVGCSVLAEREPPRVVAAALSRPSAPATPLLPLQLMVALPTSPALLDSERVLVRPRSGEFALLQGTVWPDRATRLWQDRIVETLQRDAGLLAVERQGSGFRGDLLLATSLQRFELDYAADPAEAGVEFVATVIDVASARAVGQRRFAADAALIGREPLAAARQLQALQQAQIDDLLSWLRALLATLPAPGETSGSAAAR